MCIYNHAREKFFPCQKPIIQSTPNLLGEIHPHSTGLPVYLKSRKAPWDMSGNSSADERTLNMAQQLTNQPVTFKHIFFYGAVLDSVGRSIIKLFLSLVIFFFFLVIFLSLVGRWLTHLKYLVHRHFYSILYILIAYQFIKNHLHINEYNFPEHLWVLC